MATDLNPAAKRNLAVSSALVAVAVAGLLGAFTYRDGRRLTFDAYHYCEMAKQFTHEWPDRFGNHWPFGYPLLGGLLGRLGVPGFESLVIWSVLSIGALSFVAAKLASGRPQRLLLVTALAASPVIVFELFGALTELPFAAALLVMAYFLSCWPERRALWGAAGSALVAFGFRYAGVIAFAILAVWTLWQWPALKTARRRGELLGIGALTFAIAGGLLLLNVLKSGHTSGADRSGASGFAALPLEFCDFGWSLPAALGANGLRFVIDPESVRGHGIGGLMVLALLGLCAWSWWKPASPASRPLALATAGYTAGMAVLHCIGSFDALYTARTCLPVVFPAGLLLLEKIPPRGMLGIGCGLLACDGFAAWRGMSHQIGGDVAPAVASLKAELQPDDVVLINDDAFSLAAYLPQRTTRTWAQYWRDDLPNRFLVVSGKPADRSGASSQLAADWEKVVTHLVSSGQFRYLYHSPGLVALERIAKP